MAQNPEPIELPTPVGIALVVVVIILLMYVVYINTVAPCFGNWGIPAAPHPTGEEKSRACKKALAGLVIAAGLSAIGVNAYSGRNPANLNQVI